MELMVLLALVRLGDDAYGAPISKELLNLAGREVALGSIYAALERLEQKEFVTSSLGDPTPAGRPGQALFSGHTGRPQGAQDDSGGTHEFVERHTAAGRKALIMNRRESNPPPRLALWLLRRVSAGSDNEALAGDLVEQFREGRPARWFWKQVLLAIAVGMWAGIDRRHGAEACYAVAGTVATIFLGPVVHATRTIVPS